MDPKLYECPICNTSYDNNLKRPRSLPCGHSFCSTCINTIKQQTKIVCSICREEHTLPESGNFPVVFAYEELMMKMRNGASTYQERGWAKEMERPVFTLLQNQQTVILSAIQKWQECESQLVQRLKQCTVWKNLQEHFEGLLQSLLIRVQYALEANRSAKEAVKREEARITEQMEIIKQKQNQLDAKQKIIREITVDNEAWNAVMVMENMIKEEKEAEIKCQAVIDADHAVAAISQANSAVDSALETAAVVRDIQEGTTASGNDKDKDKLKSVLSQAIDLKRLKDALECKVCLKDYYGSHAPRTLPCGHTFCTPCVRDMNVGDVVTCPSCDKVYNIPAMGMFPACHAFDAVMNILKDAELIPDETCDEETKPKTNRASGPPIEASSNGKEKAKQAPSSSGDCISSREPEGESRSSEQLVKTQTPPDDTVELNSPPAGSFSATSDQPRMLMMERLRRLSDPARKLLQDGLVFAYYPQSTERHARITLKDDCLFVHALREQCLPSGAHVVKMIEMLETLPPWRVFLDLEWPKSDGIRRVLICLPRDTPRGRHFLLLCTGQKGPSYVGTKLFRMDKGELSRHFVCGGDYEYNNGKGGAAVLPDLDLELGDYWMSGHAGGVAGGWWSPDVDKAAQFFISTNECLGPPVFGEVLDGLETVVAAAKHVPIVEVTVVDCGVVLHSHMGSDENTRGPCKT